MRKERSIMPAVVHVSPYDVSDEKTRRHIVKHRRWILFLGLAWYFGIGLFGPLYAVFSEKIGGDILDIAVVYAVYLVVTGTSHIFFGWATDKYQISNKMIVLGYALETVATFSFLLVQNTTGLLIVEIALGLADSIATPSWNKLYTDKMDDNKVSEQWSYETGGGIIAMGVAILIGGFIVAFWSFELLFTIMGFIFLGATVITIAKYGKVGNASPCVQYGDGCGIGVAMPQDTFVHYAVSIAKGVMKSQKCNIYDQNIIKSGIQTIDMLEEMEKSNASKRSSSRDKKNMETALEFCKKD